MQWNEKELDAQFIPNVHFWTPNSEILPKVKPREVFHNLKGKFSSGTEF